MGTIKTAARRRAVGAAATATLCAATWFVSGGTALADVKTPPETGCPASTSLLWVDDLTAQGYHAPSQIDAAGNQDGWVCGKPVQEQAAENFCGGPCQVPVLYEFRDDSLTPSH
jgi:hypothetical protein